MESTLIHPNFLSELTKIAFKDGTIKELNARYIDIIGNTPVPDIDPNVLARSKANAVARWTINYSMDFQSLPTNKLRDAVAGTRLLIEVDGPLPDIGGPIAGGVIPHSAGFDSVKHFMALSTISTEIYDATIQQLSCTRPNTR